MQITASARKHGVEDADMLHAVEFAIRIIEQEYDGDIRQLIIGADTTGRLLEIVVVSDEPARLIHADVLRPKFYDYL
ncbi:hypothetical protein [Mycolicibacterium komossense]|uniref:Toxin n=1 Tax=Mycolicibacterium komossense TaxID=1779 RepID=A0ABT3CMN7_9MYCO|nr:hypothetical protein [Mycolicibacterium komossense]MCV7230677.1 hypothetical protein [Mycolicibacterium komossense]